MKNALAIIIACALSCIVGIFLGYKLGYEVENNPSPSIFVMPESAINRSCEKIRVFEIFQTLPDGGLANACGSVDVDLCLGQVAFIPNQESIDFFDGKRITVAKGQCFVFDGVYSYTNREEKPRTVTVPLVWVIDTPKRN